MSYKTSSRFARNLRFCNLQCGCRSNISWISGWFEAMSYDCVEALNATKRYLSLFFLVYLWTEAISAHSSPVSSVRSLPSAARKVWWEGGRQGSSPLAPAVRVMRTTRGRGSPKPIRLSALTNFDGFVRASARNPHKRNTSWSRPCFKMRLTKLINHSERMLTEKCDRED